MTLQYQLDSIDGLSEEISKLYVEKGGKFILDVTGHEKTADKDKDRNLIPKSRLGQEIEKRKEAEKDLKAISDLMIEDIPEDMRSIVPDLAPSAKIAWLKEANKLGFFNMKKAESIDSKKPGDQKPTDFENMNPQAIMATGYKSK